jgi:hypothetical protein
MMNKNTIEATDVLTSETKPAWLKIGSSADRKNDDGTCTVQCEINGLVYGAHYRGGGFATVHQYGPFCGGKANVDFADLAAYDSLPKQAAPALRNWVRPIGF